MKNSRPIKHEQIYIKSLDNIINSKSLTW